MLEYSYVILQKFSFDKQLFKKELCKCISYLNDDEVTELQKWVRSHFTQDFPKLQSLFNV